MGIPPNLNWVEVDLPDLVVYKDQVVADDKPKCKLQRSALDLSD